MGSKLWAVHAALFDLFTEGLSVPVFDGPTAKANEPKTYVLVGSDGGETGLGEPAQGTGSAQTWSNIGATRRHEEGELICGIRAWSGATDITPLRLTVASLCADIEALLMADKQLGGVLPPSGWCELTGIRPTAMQLPSGALLWASLTLAYSARLQN